ncbi:excinuclease ABC subunit C [Halobacteriales archaeon QH_10_67_13]|nr:MAG: excinuclease ABC subunit C [Halobacteriales archaeon QH_10_67_13]
MNVAAVRDRATDLPRDPGVYQFLDGERVLYVGKAVELPDRVRSYADPRSERIRQMVARADQLDVAVTDTESQALLLEANLIKRHRPRYNVRLKDDKSYPVVALTDHPVPRIEVTRDPGAGATVYGPFTDMTALETVVKALRRVYGLRGCSDHKYSGRDRPCLDYEMGLCAAPCTGEISEAAYREEVAAVERFFEGETGMLAEPLRAAMEAAAGDQEFERAANLRDALAAVERFEQTRDAAVHSSPDGRRLDALGVSLTGAAPTVAVLRAENGQLVDRERPAAVLGAFVPQYYADRELPDAVLCPEGPAGEGLDAWLEGAGVELRVPAAGREASLVELAGKNARRGRTREADSGCRALADTLGIDSAARVEGFDVSHAQGKSAVGSDVTFLGGSPEKADYRRRKLTDENDDYANMRALLRWRADRAVEGRDDRPDPDLLLIDGGAGQLEAAREALSAAGWSVPIIALAKADELVVTPDRTYDWSDDAPQLRLLQRVRDEAHRFARQYHATLRDEVSTPLDSVPGVGPELRQRLLGRFGSVDAVRTASPDELRAIDGVGERTASQIADHL